MKIAQNKGFITPDQIKLIFSEVEVILGVNTTVLNELEERMREWSNTQKIGDIFLNIVITNHF